MYLMLEHCQDVAASSCKVFSSATEMISSPPKKKSQLLHPLSSLTLSEAQAPSSDLPVKPSLFIIEGL